MTLNKKTPKPYHSICQSQNAFISSFPRRKKKSLLPPKRAALRQPSLPAGGLTQHLTTPRALDHGLRVAEHRRDREAARALYVHEEGPWAWD